MIGLHTEIWLSLMVIACSSIALTAGSVPLAKRLAFRLNLLDSPKEGKMHVKQTPYLGGLAIAATTLTLPLIQTGWDSDTVYVLLAALVVCTVGVIDDWKLLSPKTRLALEAVAAGVAVHAGAELQIFGSEIDFLISASFLVISMNSFNLLDNMDGLLATIALGISVPVTVAAAHLGSSEIASVTTAVGGSCLGFLIFNWHPASIFMGDAGSLVIGFLVTSSIMRLTQLGGEPVAFGATLITVILTTGIALFDTGLVVLSRLRKGSSIMKGGTDHTSHRLHALGLPIRSVSLLVGTLSLISASIGAIALVRRFDPAPIGLAIFSIGALALMIMMRQPELHRQTPPSA